LNVAVTGGGSGIGRAVAEHFTRTGANVTIGDIDGSDVALDVSDRDSFAGFLDAAEERHGPLDVLVNNAGVDWVGPFHEEPDEVSRREIDINLMGTILGTRLALARMLPRGKGHIVNVASGVGRVPLPGSAVYSATKHGIVGLTESLRLEYRDSGVRFSLIQPAQVDTGMLAGLARPKLLPVVSAEDVAAAVVRAVREDRFELWVPASQGVTARLGYVMPRRLRELVMRVLGVGRIAGDADLAERRAYHERTFGRS
jgi:NAD(P)-dependent dehydrogenase (short-subunit alcohol dehydrogenase family)